MQVGDVMLMSAFVRMLSDNKLFDADYIDIIDIKTEYDNIYITYRDIRTGNIDYYCINCCNNKKKVDSLKKICIYSNNIKLNNSNFVIKYLTSKKLVLEVDENYLQTFRQIMIDNEYMSGNIFIYLEDSMTKMNVYDIRVIEITNKTVECSFNLDVNI